MIRPQRQAHLLVWVVLAPVLALVLLVVLLTGPLEVTPPPPAEEGDDAALRDTSASVDADDASR